MLVLAQRTSLAAIGVVFCGSLSIGCDGGGDSPEPGDSCTTAANCGGCEEDEIAYCNTASNCDCRPPGGTGGTGGGTTQALEDCTNGGDDDEDDLVDCQDVSDCACAPNCIDLFLEAVDAGACVSSNLLNNAGFEEDPDDPDNWTDGYGFPRRVGPWGGDLAAVVGTVPGVVPLEGSAMMQFTSTDSNPLPTESSSSERVQLIVANSYLGRRLCGVASFARVEGDILQTDSAFAVVTAWYDGPPSAFDDFTTSITSECFGADENFRCGNGPLQIAQTNAGEWFRASSTTVLPTVPPDSGNATSLVMVRAQENVCNDGSVPEDPDFCPDQEGPELDGHFVDDVGLFVVPDPPTQLCIDAMAPPP